MFYNLVAVVVTASIYVLLYTYASFLSGMGGGDDGIERWNGRRMTS
jgi:hypothetical protein